MSCIASIIIPCFNGGTFLREALQSVEKCPEREACEVIIVNDGSTDAQTLELLTELQREGYQIIHQINRGPSAARNAGIKASQGTYILPLDSDNRIRPGYISEGVRVLDSQPRIGVVYSDAEFFGEKEGRWNVAKFSLNLLIQGSYIDTCALFRRCIWEEVGGYDENMLVGWEDWDFWLRVALKNWGFFHLDEVHFDYRFRHGSHNSKANQHIGQLSDYIFSKEALKDANAIRQRQLEIARLFYLEHSPDYRLGRAVLSPLRKIRQLLKGKPAKLIAGRPASRR